MSATVEKAQQLPQPPWFLTGVTAPLVRQSTLSSAVRRPVKVALGPLHLNEPPDLKPSFWERNSSSERSANSLTP
jgi:hypothetical protein